MRRSLRIAVGDAGNEKMLRAMRAHANCAEYVPLGLRLIFLVEQSGAGAPYVHGRGACLLVGRVLHAIGVSRVNEQFGYRVADMALMFTPIIMAALSLLVFWAGGTRKEFL